MVFAQIRSFIFNRLWTHRISFIKYATVGSSGFLLDLALLIFFADILNWRPLFAVLLVQLFTLTYNFLLNKYWSFGAKRWSHIQVVRYSTLMAWNYFFSFLTMYLFNEHFGIHYIIVRCATVMLMVGWNFLLYKFWVYR